MGWPNGSYRVGPLGRLNMVDVVETPLAGEELKVFKALNDGAPVENTLYYHYARMIEVLFSIEKIEEILDNPETMGSEILDTKENFQGEGVGCLEAPRGTLIHHYRANEDRRLTMVNLIVSTGHNNFSMCNAVDMVAKEYVKDHGVTEGMLNRVEAAVRAHDPCLSCSTHAVGQMPIMINVKDSKGQTIKTMTRE